ncbi:MAG: DUF5058 family protein [Clostridia bacterium]|nr:DUF5058 family protein [Clostridia bacterium]
MEFSVNHPILFVIVGMIIAVVVAQSVYFLIKAYRRALELGVDKSVLKKTIISSALFTIAPAIAIVISIVTLAPSLGIALPWLRLSVIGSLSYETVAATNAASGMGKELSDFIGNMTGSEYVTIIIVMTVSILVGIWLAPVLAKKMQKGMSSFEAKDKKWSDILQNSLFIGMISAFVGFVFCDVSRLWTGGAFVEETVNGVEQEVYYSATSGLIPVCVMAVSAVLMLLCGLVMKVTKWKWINDYALPICMVVAMALAIPISNALGG